MNRQAAALARAARPQPWAAHAACRGMGPALFFPARGEDTSPAKEVCAACPVAGPCYEHAVAGERFGVWGASSERERRDVRRERGLPEPALKRAACPAGHEYTLENTYLTPKGYRRCRACNRLKQAARKAAKRAAERDREPRWLTVAEAQPEAPPGYVCPRCWWVFDTPAEVDNHSCPKRSRRAS